MAEDKKYNFKSAAIYHKKLLCLMQNGVITHLGMQ